MHTSMNTLSRTEAGGEFEEITVRGRPAVGTCHLDNHACSSLIHLAFRSTQATQCVSTGSEAAAAHLQCEVTTTGSWETTRSCVCCEAHRCVRPFLCESMRARCPPDLFPLPICHRNSAERRRDHSSSHRSVTVHKRRDGQMNETGMH